MSILKHKAPVFSLIIIIAFLFCLVSVSSMTGTLFQNQEYFIKSFGEQQEALVRQVKLQCKNILIEKNGAGTDAIKKILENLETSGNRFWFFMSGNKIIFLKNDFELKKLNISSVDKLLNSFRSADGYNISGVYALADTRTDGTVLFSAAKDEGNILASVQFFEANGNQYALGMCTTQNYILSKGNMVKHITYSIINLVLVCLALFCVIILSSLKITRKNQEILICKKAIHAKNIKIEELTESKQKSDFMYNRRTKLYGKKVFHSLLKRTNNPELFPVSLLIIDIKYSENITYEDSVLELSPSFQKLLPENSIALKANESRLVILFFKTDYEEAKACEQRLLKHWNNILNKLEISVDTYVYTNIYGQESLLESYTRRLKSSQLSKKERQ